jgi:hypothetical protein
MPIKTASTYDEGLWKRAYFELALNRWLKTHEGQIDDSTMLLFHMSAIVLHTNMANIHGLVRNFLKPIPSRSVPEAVKQWRDSYHCKIAVLHTTLLTRAAQRIAVSQRSKGFAASASTGNQGPSSRLGEGPHAAICVYLAILVLWAAEVAREHPNWAVAKAALEKGCNILSQFKIRIATVLMNTLRRLGENID